MTSRRISPNTGRRPNPPINSTTGSSSSTSLRPGGRDGTQSFARCHAGFKRELSDAVRKPAMGWGMLATDHPTTDLSQLSPGSDSDHGFKFACRDVHERGNLKGPAGWFFADHDSLCLSGVQGPHDVREWTLHRASLAFARRWPPRRVPESLPAIADVPPPSANGTRQSRRRCRHPVGRAKRTVEMAGAVWAFVKRYERTEKPARELSPAQHFA